MKFKLDENLGSRSLALFVQAGHDASSVAMQGLQSCTDERLIELCTAESRALVTLDMDYANPLRFNPALYRGIAVLRVGPRCEMSDIELSVRTLIGALEGAAGRAAVGDHRLSSSDLFAGRLTGPAIGLVNRRRSRPRSQPTGPQ